MLVYDANELMYLDQTGCFPFVSNRGNQYTIVVVAADINFIEHEPLKKRSSAEMIHAYLAILK